jgi:hypothetical protein
MMKGHGEKLSRKQEQAIVALLEQATLEQAAAAVGVHEKTLRLWLKLPAFQAEYRAARRRIVDCAIVRLQQCTTGAVLALNRNLTCVTPSVEVRAAQAIIQWAIRGIELGEVLNGASDVTDDRKTIETTSDIVTVLAERLGQVDAAELPTGEKARLTATLADALLKAISVDVLDGRLAALQTVLLGRKEKTR